MRSTMRAALMASLSALALATPAWAQDTSGAAEEDVGATIIVTGSRSTTRTVEDSPVPVDVLSAEAITNGGQTETNKILNKLVPSFNFPQPAISDGSDALRPATLRGLSPDQTLVLVNGKRRHVSSLLNINGTVGRGAAAVDMNSIPALAIDRIEVLRDGASSQYGSDAIAGVINIRLKTKSSGGRAAISYGKYDTMIDNVANVTGLQTTAGQPILDPTDGRYFAANTSGDRKVSDGESYTVATNIGLPFFGADGGYLNFTAEYRHRGRTNRQGFDLRPNYIRPTATTWDPRELTANRLQFRFGDPEADDFNFFLNAATPLGDNLELYSWASFNQRDSLSAANYRQASSAANRDFSVLAPGTTPTNANFVALTPDGFLPFIKTDLTDYSATVGLRTTAGEWNADASFGYGHNSFDYQAQNTLNTSFGPASQRTFDAGGLRYGQYLANLDISREYEVGFAKPLNVAFGAEYRAERFQIRPGDRQSWAAGPLLIAPISNSNLVACSAALGVFDVATSRCNFPGRAAGPGAQGFPGLPASALTNVKRSNIAGYVEFDTDPIEGMTTTVAARFEHYSDFGNTISGKFAARYEFTPGFALRGSISNGFRAPSLHQQSFTTTSTNFIGGVPVDVLTAQISSPIARALGSKDLKAEKSINMSAGFTANPINGVTLTVDYYNIKIKDRIVLTENLGASTSATDTAIRNYLVSQGLAATAARFFINGLDTRTQGVDAVLNWRLPLDGFGKWSLTAAYNYNQQKIIKRNNTLGPLASIPGIVLFGRVESLRFTEGQPRDKVVLSLDGDIGMFGITARSTRYGKVTSPGSAVPIANPTSLTEYGPDDIFLRAKWITDLELRFKPAERFNIAIGADNVFDIYPDRSPFGARPAAIGGTYPANQQYIPFSIFSPFGFNGRYLYARASIDF
jgi:iron complex outermembrane recepter protein